MCLIINVLLVVRWEDTRGFVADGLFQSEEEIAHSACFGPTLPVISN